VSAPAPPAPTVRGGLRAVVHSRLAAQAAAFAAGDAASTALGAVAAAVLARQLDTTAYGSYSFAVSLLAFSAMFAELGLFLPAARLAARADAAGRRQITGAALALYVPVGLGFAAVMFLLSFGVDGWFNVHVGTALRVISPLAVAYPLGFVVLQLAQGADRVAGYSLASALGRAAFLAAVAGMIVLDRVGLTAVLAAHAATLLLAWLGLAARLRPSRAGLRAHVPALVTEARRYGFQVYLGRVLSMGSYNLDVLMVAAFADPRSVGFYSLAAAAAYLVGLPGMGLANALFAQLTTRERLERRWLAGGWALGLGAAGLGSLLAPLVIPVVLTPAYLPVAALLPPLALAAAVRGVTSLYNVFLAAHARGRELRNVAIGLTAANVAANAALIPPFGAAGAAWASLLALIVNLLAHRAAYLRVVAAPEAAAA
jgi:O-antigen/teichoic acid export membrane protein